MTDLLRLNYLAATGHREEDGFFIIEAKSRTVKLPKPCCLLQSLEKNGTKRQRYRDFAVQSQTTFVEIRRQRFRCKECGATHYEVLRDLDADRRLTTRFREHLERQAVEMPFTTVAHINGVHETLIRRIFDDFAAKKLKGYIPKMPRVLGMDEIYLHRSPRFVIGDVENKMMLDMRPSRREIDLREYLKFSIGREDVEVVCQDMWSGYRKLTKELFPNAVTVIDKYHVQRTANYGMELVRKSLFLNMPAKERVRLKRKRAVFLARWDNCKPETQAMLSKLFEQYPVLATAYDIKERFYDIYEAQDRAEGDHRMAVWQASLPPEMERPFKVSLDAIGKWRPHILRYFDHRFTSGYIERLNGMIRKMHVQGAGYSFETLRAKAILKHGHFMNVKFGEQIIIGRPEIYIPTYYPAGFGVPLSTLEDDLEAGTF